MARQHGAIALSSSCGFWRTPGRQAMAASLAAGSVSSLAFAGRFVSVALTLASALASTMVAPAFAELVAQRDWNGCRGAMRRYGRMAWTAAGAAAVALILGSGVLVRVCLQRGAFRATDTAAVVPVLALSAVQVPFFAASRVHYRLLLALKRADLVLYCGILNLALDVVLNIVLMRRLGVAGIALATSLWMIATWIFLSLCARRVLRDAASVQA